MDDTIEITKSFLRAAKAGDDSAILNFIESGVHVDCCKDDGRTAILYAASANQISTAKLLLEMGAKIDVASGPGKRTVLTEAVENGHIAMFRFMLKRGADVKLSPRLFDFSLHIAIDRKYEEVALAILDAGADPNSVSEKEKVPIIYSAIHNLSADFIIELINRGAEYDKGKLFGMAASSSRHEIIDYLIEGGYEPNRDQIANAIWFAITGGATEIVNRLINMGFDVNSLLFEEQTALENAVHYGREYIVELLLVSGADPNRFEDSYPPVLTAIKNGYDKIEKLLVEYGADPMIDEGEAAAEMLKAACDDYDRELYDKLLELGVAKTCEFEEEQYDNPPCPDCQSENVVPILYGYLSSRGENIVEAGLGESGGCMIFDDSPGWACKACGHRFSVKPESD